MGRNPKQTWLIILLAKGRPPESTTIHPSCLVATDFTRQCARLWVDLRGRRFRVYRPCSGTKPGPKPGKCKIGLAGLKRRVKNAMDRLVSRSSGVDGDSKRSSGVDGDSKRSSGVEGDSKPASTILGLPRTSFLRGAGQANPVKEFEKLKKFNAWTKKKNILSAQLVQARKLRGNPYRVSSDLDPRRHMRRGSVISGHKLPSEPETRRVQRPLGGGNIIVLDTCKESVPEKEGYVARRPETASAKSLVHQLRSARMVVMDSPWQLDNLTQHSDRTLAIYFGVIALGKPSISRAQYLQSSSRGPLDRSLVLYRPVFQETKLSLHLGEAFKRQSPFLRDVISDIVKISRSVWTLTADSASAGACFQSPNDVRKLLLNTRRATHSGGGVLGSKSSMGRPVV